VPLFWITGGNYYFTFIDLLIGIGGIRLGFESLVANMFSKRMELPVKKRFIRLMLNFVTYNTYN